jgi:hypothetical protein
VLCGDAVFAQGLRCAKLCRTSDEPCTLASLSAPTGFLVCYWTLVGKTRRSTVLGPLAAQIGDSIARIAAHSHAGRRPSRSPAGRGLLPASPLTACSHSRARAALRSRRAHVRRRRAAAARAQTMGFGAGDIKDKFRTYDGDADKRLRKKLEKSGKFDESFKTPVRIEKINVEVMGRWVAERLAELLGFEDDVLSELVMNMLAQTRDAKTGQDKRVDPQQLQVQLTGFLNKQAQPFVAELWKLLLDAQDSPHGIPRAFVERKKKELVARRAEGGERDRGGFSKRDDGRGDDKRGERRARSRSRSRERGREADQRRVVRAARGRSRSRSRERSRRGASSPERRPRKRSGFSSAPAAPAPAPAPAPAKEESPPAWNSTRGPSSRSTPSNRRLTVDRSPQAATRQARAARALAVEGVAEYAGRLLLY